ncbi:hypothetical protein [Amycolatopsis dongchuanensis]|uniref:Uncharacterized protein n=1 Tax=Amycolatopsis dongchuanensis TaxID=1070866 RepID=A0ABP9R617_9PSEU
MPVVDARQFYWSAPPFEEQPLFRAPEEVMTGWTEIANQAQIELERFGLPATVMRAEEDFSVASPGVQILVCSARPFGVVLNWEPPIAGTPEFTKVVLDGAVNSPLLTYVAKGRIAMLDASAAILNAAGFITMKDYANGDGSTYDYRVLFAPKASIIER